MATCTKCRADSNHINDVGVCPAEFGVGWIDNVKEGDRFHVNKPIPAAWLERDSGPPSPPLYTLKEIETLAREWIDSLKVGDTEQSVMEWRFTTFLAWLARREREGRDA